MADTSNRGGEAGGVRGGGPPARIGVLVIAAEPSFSVATLVDGVADGLRARITHVFIGGGTRENAAVGPDGGSLAEPWPTVVHLARESGDGDTQKAAFRLAAEHALDAVVVLPGAGTNTPEVVGRLVAPLDRGECDAVLGVREAHAAPAWRRAGVTILTAIDRLLAVPLRDVHSGWRAYDVTCLASLPFQGNARGRHFDLQLVLQLIGARRRIVEVPLPPLGDEDVLTADVMRRAWDTSMDALRLRLAKRGFLSGHLGGVGDAYGLKSAENSSHSIVLRWLGQMPAGRVLDLGCSSGLLAERMRALGHTVTGVDMSAIPGVTERVHRFLEADLDRGLPAEVGDEGRFDAVVAADVLEHVRDPERLLRQIDSILVPRGTLIVSVPNFGHWYPRGRTALGLFDYDQRGILDRGHVRFFTRRGLLDLLRRSGFAVTRQQATGLPLEVLSGGDGVAGRGLRALDRAAVGVWPTLFGYQFVMRCETPALVSRTVPPGGERGVATRA